MELTKAEIELIRLKREEDDNKAKQDALKEQLEYDKALHDQAESFNKAKSALIRKYENTNDAYNKLLGLGVREHVSKRDYKQKVTASDYITRKLKPEDITTEEVAQISIITVWGDIGVEDNGKCSIPSMLSNRYQSYKVETVASKILDQVMKEKMDREQKEKQTNYIDSLIQKFTEESPTGTIFTQSKEWVRNPYKNGDGHYQQQLTIQYPNKSWAKINVYIESWNIVSKFDSKYIRPETNDEWLTYLSK